MRVRGGTWRAVIAGATPLALVLAIGCRTQTLWAGVEVQGDGRIRLVAEEPRCGCLTVANATDASVKLQSMRGLQILGQTTLPPKRRASFRFDSAGSYTNAVYVIEVTTPEGQRLDAARTLRIDERPAWVFCEEATCEYAPLMMNLADLGR